MKLKGKLSFFCILLSLVIGSAAYTYEHVTSESSCQSCHTDFDGGTEWHEVHEGYVGKNCGSCHGNGMGNVVKTKTCARCHSSDTLDKACSLAALHDSCSYDKNKDMKKCISCHSSCTMDDAPEDAECSSPPPFGGCFSDSAAYAKSSNKKNEVPNGILELIMLMLIPMGAIVLYRIRKRNRPV